MPMYDAAEKIATGSVNMRALLDTPVLVNGQPTPLKAQLTGDATILLFVRNGA